jgi:hypothetical protein
MQADFAWAGGVSLQRIAWFKAIALLASAILLAYLFAVLFQMWILWGKGFGLSETLPNAVVSAELSWFMLPAFCTAFGAIIGAFVGRQLLVAVFVVAIALAYQCLSNRLWVAALFSVPAVLIALSPLLSSHFVLGKKNV